MMNIYTPPDLLGLPQAPPDPPLAQVVSGLLRALRRRWWTILGGVIAALGLGIAYLLLATPQFTATTAILVDIRQSNPFRQDPLVIDSNSENARIESVVEALRSEGLARAVVARLDLVHDPVFQGIGPGILGGLVALVTARDAERSDAPTAEARRRALAVRAVTRILRVRRIGLTAVIELTVRTPDRVLSARLANAVVDAYMQSQVAAQADVAAQASAWLQGRLAELRDQAIAADRAVQDYRAQYNILDTDRGRFNEQQLGEVSTQLTTARARLAEAQARFDRIRSLTPERLADAPPAAALENTVIVGLRRQYLDARARDARWSAQYGPAHAAAANARAEMAELQRSIQNELNRIAESTRSDLEIAAANEAETGRQLAVLAAAAAAADADRIMLRALQSTADASKAMHENFLQRYTQAVQDQSFPIPEARVLTAAEPPLSRSHPVAWLVLPVALVVGLLLGAAAAGLQELLDRSLRTPVQLKAVSGQDCLGLLPRLPSVAVARHAPVEDALPRRLPGMVGPLRLVVDQPESAYAEAVRGIALRMAWQRRGAGCHVLGCVGAAPGAGASTLAANLAHAFAELGCRTLLVDLDWRDAALTRALAPRNAGGAAELAQGAGAPSALVWRDPRSGLDFLPEGVARPGPSPGRLLAPAPAEALLARLREGYDRVVIDLPAEGADASALAEILDGLVLVAGWGGLDAEALAERLDGLGPAGREKLLGLVFSRVEPGRLRSYGGAVLAAGVPA